MYRPGQNQTTQSRPSVRGALFSNKNRDTLTGLLVQDFQIRTGQPLTPKQLDRLERTLDHYVEEVYDKQGEQALPVLNREVLKATSQDFAQYIHRGETIRNSASTPTQTIMNEAIYQDTGKRFELLQQERHDTKALPPAVPDFRVSLDDDGPSSVQLFEQAKKARDAEINRVQLMTANDRMDPGIQQRIAADDMFRSGQMTANRNTDLAVIERRNAPRQPPIDLPLTVIPDRRELFTPLSRNAIEPSGMPRELGQANSNVAIVQPHLASPLKTNLQQDVLIRQDDIVNYKEVENNLFIYSADRDWLNSSVGQNRYVFSIVFDPAMNSQKFPPTPAVQERFRNITRIELVKAILPVEALDVLITQDSCGNNTTAYQDNVLSFPYISLNIEELDSNNYGTDNILDRCFAVLQYDANWYSDPSSLALPQDSRGYTAFIPKFLKCQRVYSPTPLSTLQKMTCSLLRPDGTALSLSQDTLDIQNIWAGNNAAGASFTASAYDGVDGGGNPYYFFIQTNTFFSRYQISVGDRIRIGGFTYNPTTLAANPGLGDFAGWINQAGGLLVSAIGYGDGSPANYTADGPNSVGYANYIIVQARYADPTTGSTGLAPFSGITAALAANPANLLAPRRLINLNRQIQLVFRIITREMDSVAQLRPDNVS